MHVNQLVNNYIGAWLQGDEKVAKNAWQPLNGQVAGVAKSIDGKAPEFHNAGVKLTQILQDYSHAYQLLEIGSLKFPTDTDLLADLLYYGISCKSLADLKKYYDELSKIDRSAWTWRAFHFSIEYLIELYKMCQSTEEKSKYSEQIEKSLAEYREYSKKFIDQSDREKSYNLAYEFYVLKHDVENALNVLKDAIKEIPGKCSQCALQLADYYFEAGMYEDVIAPATVAAMVIDVQPAIKYSYLYFILGASREYKARKEGATFTEDIVRPIYRSYFSALVHSEEDDSSRISNIKKRIRVLEYDSGINSGIDFSEFE